MLTDMVKGTLIGVANIIPGVSGGTLALMLGIYKRIMDALQCVNAEFLRKLLAVAMFRRGAWYDFLRYFKESDFWFLVRLAVGALLAILVASRLIAWLLEAHHAASYAFFFGLVLWSIAIPWRYLTRHTWREVLVLLIASLMTVGLSCTVPDQQVIEKEQQKQVLAAASADTAGAAVAMASARPPLPVMRLIVIFMSAALAISAMVLPGISGSFVLLLLGVYFDILAAVNGRDFLVLGVFAFGALVGLLVFSRLMSGLLNRFFNVTMAFMTGLMLGSLYELWPFKRVEVVGEEILHLSNVWRGASWSEELTALAAFSVASVIVLAFLRLSRDQGRQWHH